MTCNGNSGARVLGAHSFRVYGRHAFGLRIGVGVTSAHADTRVATILNPARTGGSSLWNVTSQQWTSTTSVPVLLVGYVLGWGCADGRCDGGPGRDAFNRNGIDLGLGLGLDAVSPLTRFYPAAVVLDVLGIGATVALSVENITVPSVAPGTTFLLAPGERLDLATRYGSTQRVVIGAMFALTLDADLFNLAFASVFGSRLPRIGAQ
jgi:hypothetical protein